MRSDEDVFETLAYVDMKNRLAHMEDGATLKITDAFDFEGDDTHDPDLVVALVVENNEGEFVVFEVESVRMPSVH
jgi:hypothetical protein